MSHEARHLVIDFALQDRSRVFMAIPATATKADVGDLIEMLQVFQSGRQRCLCGDERWCPHCYPGEWEWVNGHGAFWVPTTGEAE